MKPDYLLEIDRPFLLELNRIQADQKAIAEWRWMHGLKPAKPQLPPDHGLFGDSHLQLDLVEMLQEPTND